MSAWLPNQAARPTATKAIRSQMGARGDSGAVDPTESVVSFIRRLAPSIVEGSSERRTSNIELRTANQDLLDVESSMFDVHSRARWLSDMAFDLGPAGATTRGHSARSPASGAASV